VKRFAIVGLALMVIGSAPAYSATIEAKRGGVIEIKGPIEFGDFDKFSAKLGAFPESKAVSLISPGGRVSDAVQIGRLLRLFEMGTVVPKGQVCGSSCVFIWAAGRNGLIKPRPKRTMIRYHIVILALIMGA
jgi:hypothetical protein